MTARVSGDQGLIDAIHARDDKGKEDVRRDMAQDGRLSMKARGILLYLVSKPDRWRTSAATIAKECDKDGRDAIAAGLKELEEHGYLVRKRRNVGGGRFAWCWIYSDDPDTVARALEQLPGGDVPDVRRGRARSPKADPARDTAATRNGKSGPGSTAAEPQVEAITGFPVDGLPVHGSAVDGEPGDIENPEEDLPPQPPASGGSPDPAGEDDPAPASGEVCEHGRRSCRACGTSPRAQAWAEREQAKAAAELAEEAGRRCGVCTGHGTDGAGQTVWLVAVPGTQTPIAPRTRCAHDRSHAEVVAANEELERERERAAAEHAAAVAAAGVPSSAAGRARARALFRPPVRSVDVESSEAAAARMSA